MSLGLSLLVFVVGLAYRAYINRIRRNVATPDEKVYCTYALTWKPGQAYARAVEDFIKKPGLEIPPTRFGFFALCSIFNRNRPNWTLCFRPVTWISAISAAFLAPLAYQVTHDLPSSLLVASSPLSLFLSRKALQDTFSCVWLLSGVWAIHLGNPWMLGASVVLALASREALVLYLPAFLVAWGLHTGLWVTGGLAVSLGIVVAVLAFYTLGGRQLLGVFRKLKQPTDYIRRFQSGMPHRLLVDLVLISPISLLVVLTSWSFAPLWLLAFTGVAMVVHSAITPKNVRFLLIIDICSRMLCAGLPGPWPWIVLVAGSVADLFLYRAIRDMEDPVTANLVVKLGMYQEK